MSDEWTIEKLDKMRARALHNSRFGGGADGHTFGFVDDDGNDLPNWEGEVAYVQDIRDTDEEAGISPKALLDVLNGKAVIVPVEPTREMHDAARDWAIEKYGQGVGIDGSDGCYRSMVSASPYRRNQSAKE